MSNAVILAMYLFFVTAKLVGKSFAAWLRNKAGYKIVTEEMPVPDLFVSLPLSSHKILAKPVLYHYDNKLQPSMVDMN